MILTESTTTSKRLIIDVRVTREAYERWEIGDVDWVRSSGKGADGPTNGVRCNISEEMLYSRRLTAQI